MKINLQKTCLILAIMTVLGILAGCATADYYRLKQTRMDVDFAMTHYQNAVSFGSIAPSFQAQVTPAYQAYQTAFDAAVQQAHSNYDAPTPDNVKQLADQLLSLLGSIPAVP